MKKMNIGTISGKEIFLNSSNKLSRVDSSVKRGCGIWKNKKKEAKRTYCREKLAL